CINNERLEFLGDAILEAIVSDILFRRYGDRNEGFLTNMRSKIVKRETLNCIAKQIGLDGLVRSDVPLSTTHNNYIGGNTFEALLGALYLDRDYQACYRFVEKKIIGTYINLDTISHQEENYKSKLLEWGQKHKVSVSFRLLNESVDKDFSPIFQSVVYIGDTEVGRGDGYSKKESHQKAAQDALRKIRSTKNFLMQIADPVDEQQKVVADCV
ncbi:MAG: ribonuclease III domain-containing protein, partial [Bacteroidales bacterium]|nr:ribonuclease III domain-containing protein [Bacteroidales bacterium]